MSRERQRHAPIDRVILLIAANIPLRRVRGADDPEVVPGALSDREELAGADVLDDPARTVAQLLESPLRGSHQHRETMHRKRRAVNVPSDSRRHGSRSR